MWIKIKNKSVNFNNVVNYQATVRDVVEWGKPTGEFRHFLSLEIINESETYGGMGFECDTLEEAKELVRKLDELLNVKEL